MSNNVIAFRKFDSSSSPADTHHPFFPLDVYQGEDVEGELSIKGPQGEIIKIDLPVYTLSPVGAELDVAAARDLSVFQKGCEVDLRLKIRGNVFDFFGLIISATEKRDRRTLIGVRWCEASSDSKVENERRNSSRWLCSETFLPTGIANNPIKFNDFVYFKIVDFSRDGMQLTTSLRNKLLIPGMTLNSMVSLPLVGDISLSFKLQNVRIKGDVGKELLAVGATLLQPTKHSLESISQYLLQFGSGVTPASLKAFGMAPKSIESAVEFGYVKDAQTYRETLNLRRRTYTGRDVPIEPENDLDWADYYDSKSRIIVAKHNQRTIGTVRLTFHGPGELTEYHEYIEFPSEFPAVTDLLVSGRLCTDSSYRGSDLFYGLIKQMVLAGVQSKRKYILGSCEASLAHLYERVGLQRTGIFYERTHPQKIRLEVLLMDVSETLVGRGISFKWWRRLYRDLYDYVEDFKDFEVTPLDKLRVKLYSFMGQFFPNWF